MIILGARKKLCVRNGRSTVTNFRLYDENSSSKGRSPAAHIVQTSRASQLDPLIFAEINDNTPGGECHENACATR